LPSAPQAAAAVIASKEELRNAIFGGNGTGGDGVATPPATENNSQASVAA
jgi:hypothetical protein